MYTEARKIGLIEQVIKTKDDNVLLEIESILNKKNKETKDSKNKKTIYDFVGVLSKKDAIEIKKVIHKTSEKIDENDWK